MKLVGGWFPNPSEKYAQVKLDSISPIFGVKIKNMNETTTYKVGPYLVINGVGYNPSYPVTSPFIGVITPFITGRGPPCSEMDALEKVAIHGELWILSTTAIHMCHGQGCRVLLGINSSHLKNRESLFHGAL